MRWNRKSNRTTPTKREREPSTPKRYKRITREESNVNLLVRFGSKWAMMIMMMREWWTLVSGGAQLNKCLFMFHMPVSPHNTRNVVGGRLYRYSASMAFRKLTTIKNSWFRKGLLRCAVRCNVLSVVGERENFRMFCFDFHRARFGSCYFAILTIYCLHAVHGWRLSEEGWLLSAVDWLTALHL